MSTPLVGFDATSTQRPRGPEGRAALELLRALVAHEDDPPRLRVLFSGPWGRRGPEHRFLDGVASVAVVERWRPRDWLHAGWQRGSGPTAEDLHGPDVAIAFGPAGTVAPSRQARRVALLGSLLNLDDSPRPPLATADRLLLPAASALNAYEIKRLGFDEARLGVLPPAIDSAAFFVENERLVETVRHELGIPSASYACALGPWGDAVQAGLVLDAYAEMVRRQRATPPLVILGWSPAIEREARRRPDLLRRLIVVHPPDEAVLRAVLTGAVACIQPPSVSFERDDTNIAHAFAHPRGVLEAQACGSPVVVLRDRVAEELLGDSAPMVEGTSPTAWADALEAATFDRGRRASYKQAGLDNARRYPWAPVVERLMQVWRSV